MKKSRIIILSSILVLLIGLTSVVMAEDTSEIINFKSNELKQGIINLGNDRNSDGEISIQEMSHVTGIYIDSNTHIKDLSDLKYATNLTLLNIAYDGEDLTPLANCKNLNTLYIYNFGDKKVKDLTPLSNLTKLSVLNLSDTEAENLDFLKNLKEIKTLSINNYGTISKITNIEPIKNLTKLESLTISDNRKEEEYNITDLSPLQNITTLKSIDIANSKITDLTPLKNLTNLESLYFYNNEIKSIEPLKNLTALKRLSVHSNKIKDISIIKNLKNLTQIELSNNEIEDMSVFNEIDTSNMSTSLNIQNIYIDVGRISLNEIKTVKLPKIVEQVQDKNNFVYDSKIKKWSGTAYNEFSEEIDFSKDLTEITIKTDSVGKNKITAQIIGEYDYNGEIPNKVRAINCYITYEILTQGDTSKEIEIKDQNFKKVLKENYDVDSDGKITEYDVNNVSILNIENSSIENVQGIENFKNLRIINAANNKIQDISYVMNLERLERIDFGNNYITDLSCIKNRKFKRITSLGIDGNYIDFSNNSKNLKLYLEEMKKEIENPGEDIYYKDGEALLCSFASSQKYGNPKDQEKEVKLDVKIKEKLINLGADKNSDNKLTAKELIESTRGTFDGKTYTGPIIKELDLSNLGLTDISGLQYLNGLENLNLSYNNISDITPLSNFMNICTLNLSHNKITDISSLPNFSFNSAYPKKVIDLSYNKIKDMSPINNWVVTYNTFYCTWRAGGDPMERLLDLNLSNNLIENIKGVENYTCLAKLNLSNNKITDISNLKNYDFEVNKNAEEDYGDKTLTELIEQLEGFDFSGNYIDLANEGNKSAIKVFQNKGIKFVTDNQKKPEIPFTDVPKDVWYYNAVKYNFENKMILGTTDTTFEPEKNLTRGMLVTILHRMEGAPYEPGTSKFPDVQNTKEYYYVAVKWATAKNIVSGYENGNFGPNDPITREQLAVMLNKYCRYKGKYNSKVADIETFKDANKVSNFAIWEMRWAVANGVITGTGENTLNPQGMASRAQGAAMLEKYSKNIK